MGIDFLDCVFRLEKEFGLPKRAFDMGKLDGRNERGTVAGVTAAQMRARVERTLVENGLPVPEDCWSRVRACIAATVMMSPDEVSMDSRLIEDLGFT